MASFNKVILAGNLTRDPELRYTPKGTAIARICVATSRKWKSESGELKEETTFVDIDAFGKQAETIGQYLKKGRPILLEGRLKFDQWEDKQTGQKKSRLGVVLESFQFLSDGRNSSESTVQSPQAAASNGRVTHIDPEDVPKAKPDPQKASEAPQPDGPEGDDVPF